MTTRKTNATPSRKATRHPNFDRDDYAYLTAKGWSEAEILQRWDDERKAGNGPCRWDDDYARAKLADTLKNAGA